MNDPYDPQGVAFLEKNQVAIERPPDLNASDIGELGGAKPAATPQARPFRNPSNSVVYSREISFGDLRIRVFKIPAVLHGQVLLRS